jgi:hypothetical protein
MRHAIEQRPTIGLGVALNRPRYAHELAFECIRGGAYGGIAVAPEVQERQMRRQVRVGQAARTLEVSGSRVFERRPHTMTKQQVERRFRSLACVLKREERTNG